MGEDTWETILGLLSRFEEIPRADESAPFNALRAEVKEPPRASALENPHVAPVAAASPNVAHKAILHQVPQAMPTVDRIEKGARAVLWFTLAFVLLAMPLPRRVPTFWFSESFTLAKALRVFAGKKRVLSKSSIDATPDMLDATHFRDAAYVDVFVTNDANLRDVAAGARVPIRVVTLEGFATELGLRV